MLLLASLLTLLGIAGWVALLLWGIPTPGETGSRGIEFLAPALIVVGLLVGWGAWHCWRRDSKVLRAAAERLSRFHAFMSDTNRLILRRPDPAALFEGVCQVSVTSAHLDLAVVELSGIGEIERVQATRESRRNPEAMTPALLLDAALMQHCVMKLAMATGEPLIFNDAPSDARLEGGRAWCLAKDLHALAAIPLKRSGAAVGVLLLHSATSGFFDEALIPLLGELGEDLSFALDNADRDRERYAAFEQRLRGLELFHTLFGASPVPMVVLTLADHKVVKVNALWCSLIQLTPARQIGESLEDLGCGLSVDDRAIFYASLHGNGRVQGMQTQVVASDGKLHEVLLHAHLVDYMGSASVLVVATDVSELRAAQIADRARMAAEDANKAKTKFLGQMSHELRTPLNAMLGFAQLLATDTVTVLTPRQAERVRLITHAGWHLLGLVNDVMDISRIEAGYFEVVNVCCDVAPVLDEALALTQPLARANQVVMLERELSVRGVGALADPRRLRQVLINLLTNACKYNRPGGHVKIDVSSNSAEVFLDVVDNGIGMTEEHMSHLFEPFNRLGNEGHAIEGSGIGLSLTRQLVEMMNGRIEIQSSPATGTRARIALPSCQLSLPPLLTDATLPGYEDASNADAVVLYIEDDLVNQILVEQMLLKCEGLCLFKADTGSSGIALAEKIQPDLVLLDMQLPDMSGLEVLAALRANPRTRALRVVAVSANAMPLDVAAAKAQGVIDYWTKPLELEAFLAGVATQLRGRVGCYTPTPM
ncbi:MAG: ATP-binding protein [Rhizobacter sp.]